MTTTAKRVTPKAPPAPPPPCDLRPAYVLLEENLERVTHRLESRRIELFQAQQNVCDAEQSVADAEQLFDSLVGTIKKLRGG